MEFCHKVIPTRSQYADVAEHKCHCPKGHSGKCEEFPFLNHLKSINKQVAEKIKRDATMTTGAAWKSADAGPNRILRWVMLLDDEELLKYGINMAELKPGVIAKLREKAADYDSCTLVAAKLGSLDISKLIISEVLTKGIEPVPYASLPTSFPLFLFKYPF